MTDIKEKILDLNAKKDFFMAEHLIPKDEGFHDTSFKARIIPAAIGGLGMVGSMAIASRILKKIHGKQIVPKKALIGAALTGTALGYFYPETHNSVIDYRRGEISRKAAENIIKNMNSRPLYVQKKYNELEKEITKESGFGNFLSRGVAGGINAAGRGVRAVGKATLSGFMPTHPGSSFGEKMFGYTVKGFGIGGVGYGGMKLKQKLTAPSSNNNYTTILRNNILAGNISPNEVPSSDARFINELGMR